jgi:hypothetical protein
MLINLFSKFDRDSKLFGFIFDLNFIEIKEKTLLHHFKLNTKSHELNYIISLFANEKK